MVQRLCGICPVSHHLAASKAMDRVIGAVPLTPTATALRRLMHYGQILQSHALHFFHLSSPDLLFGFDSDPARRNIIGVAQAHPDLARQGVFLRKFGQEVIRATAGKRVHGTGAVPGGVNRLLSADDHALLTGWMDEVLVASEAAVRLVEKVHRANRPFFDEFGAVPARTLSLVGRDGSLELYDGVLRVREADGTLLIDGAEDQAYDQLIAEEVKSWSYMKFPYLRSLGPELGWYRVGPLARVLNCDRIGTPGAEQARQVFRDAWGGGPIDGVLAYHWARMIELWHAAEVIAVLLRQPDVLAGELIASGQRTGSGVGMIEAPRGTLIHHYEVGDDDLVKRCNLIVSTTHNNQAMNLAIRRVAGQVFRGQELTEGLFNHIEVAVRAFDPCLSCATHALGRMPLEVTLQDPGGTVLDRLSRDGSGRLARG